MADQPGDAMPRSARVRAERRRRGDFTPRDWVYLLALVLIAASVWVAIRSDARSQRADRHAAAADVDALGAIRQVQEGRARSITITCAVLSSISEAGRAAIAGSPYPPPPAEEKALVALGFPPFKTRHKQQAKAGALYVRTISTRVNRELRQAGRKPIKGLVRSDGTIDCKVLQQAGLVPNRR